MRGLLGIFLLTFGLLVRAREHDSFSPTTSSSLNDAFTDSSDESAAPSSFSDSASRHNNNDWLTDDDDDDDDDVMDESQLNSQPAAKAAGSKPKTAAVPLTTTQLESKILYELNGFRRLFGAGPLIRLATLDIGAKAANDKMQKAGVGKKDASIKHGQLQCIKLTSSDKVPAECISFWMRQMQDYDWSKPEIKDNNRFFATAIYKAATHAGVAVKKGPSGRYFAFILTDPAPDPKKLKTNAKSYTDMFTAVAGAKCETGFTEFQGSCYKLHKDKKNWMDANAECLKEVAVLPPIGGTPENEFFKQGLLKGQTGFTWLGFNDRLKESMYMSVEGSQIHFMDWVNGQPTGKNENCVGFNNKALYGTMADYPCTTASTYVCKKPLQGDITYNLKLEVPSMVWLNDLSNPGSLASQQLSAKFQKALQEIYKKAGVKSLKSASIISVSDGLPPQPAPAYPVYSYLGKRQITAIKVTPAPTTPPKPKPSGGASKPTVKPTPPKVPTTKPKKKVTIKLSMTFGPSGVPPDPTAPLQDYLRANGNKLPAPLSEQIKLVSVSIAPPGSSACPSICSTSCVSSCAPRCCFSSAPAPAPVPYMAPQPCVPTPYNPCPPKPVPTQPAPTQPKVQAKRPAAKCTPTPTTSCPPPFPYPPAFPQYPAPPCVPTIMNNFCRNVVAKPLAANRGGFFAPKPVVNPARVTYRYPLAPAYRRIMPRLVSSRPVSRAVLPVPQAGGYRQCIPSMQSPCPPIMMPPPPPLPQPMMIPQLPMPQMAPPCIPNITPNCPPKPAPKKPAAKAAKPAAPPKPLNIMGCTYPPCSMVMLPPPPPPPPPPMPAPMPMTVPCMPSPFNSCLPPSPPKAGKTKSKSTAPKPCSPVPTPGCMPPMPMPMPMPPMPPPMPMPMPQMPMPQMPMPQMPMPMPCGTTPANPCAKPVKPPPPKPMLIKLPAIQIQVPQQPAPPMMPPMMPPMPPCPPMCGAAPPNVCPPACPKPCCRRSRLGRSVE